MAIIPVNPSGAGNPNPYLLGLNTLFNQTFAKSVTETWIDKLAMTQPGQSEVEGFAWTDPGKRAREWKGERQHDQAAPRTYYLSVKVYEKSFEIDKFKFTDDRYGIFQRSIADNGDMLAKEPDYQLRDLIFNKGSQTGAYQVGLDGLTHWNSAHPNNFYDSGYGTFANDLRGGITVDGLPVGGELNMPNFVSAYYNMMLRRASHGEVAGIVPNWMVHGTMLDAIAKQLINATFLGLKSFYGQTDNVGAAENMMKNQVSLLRIPDFGTTLDWLLLDTAKGMPFVILKREMGVYAQQTAENDQPVYARHMYNFGGYSRFAVGFSHPLLSTISGPTAAV